MISFMIIGLPRSGTTWAANWLTTERSLCLHDPLFEYHYDQLDKIECDRTLGVSCTGLWNFTDWLNRHPARKVILHRSLTDVNASLEECGMPRLGASVLPLLSAVKGMHVEWTEIFDKPEPIHDFLLGDGFDAIRHAELRKMHVEPDFTELRVNREVSLRLLFDMKEATCLGVQ